MEGVFTTSVNESTIDESPMTYRRVDEILNIINPTAEVIEHILPVYNFKASKPVIDEDTMDGEEIKAKSKGEKQNAWRNHRRYCGLDLRVPV